MKLGERGVLLIRMTPHGGFVLSVVDIVDRRMTWQQKFGSVALGTLGMAAFLRWLSVARNGQLMVRISSDLVEQVNLPYNVQRALLRETLSANGTGKIAHHLIPLESITKYKSLMERAAKGGFNINGANNGVLLNIADHVDNHPIYNQVVLERIGRIEQQAKTLTDREVAELMQHVADLLRAHTDARTFLPWF